MLADDLGACLQTYTTSFQARRPFTMEYRLRRADGDYRWLLDQGVPRYTPEGEFAGYIDSCVDITERKRAEEQRREAELEARRLAAHARLQALSRSEVEPYLDHQFRQAGIQRPCFEPAALELLASASEGIPRSLKLLARAAWIEAAKDKTLQISAAHIQSALELVPGTLELRQTPAHP